MVSDQNANIFAAKMLDHLFDFVNRYSERESDILAQCTDSRLNYWLPGRVVYKVFVEKKSQYNLAEPTYNI